MYDLPLQCNSELMLYLGSLATVPASLPATVQYLPATTALPVCAQPTVSQAVNEAMFQSELLKYQASMDGAHQTPAHHHHQLPSPPIKPHHSWLYAAAAAAAAAGHHPYAVAAPSHAAAAAAAAAAASRLTSCSPPGKRPRLSASQTTTAPANCPTLHSSKLAAGGQHRSTTSSQTPVIRRPRGHICLDHLHNHDHMDVLICGNCRELFQSLADLLRHKLDYCKLRFACKCSHEPAISDSSVTSEDAAVLQCGICNEPFATAMQLMQHFQDKHSVSIFQLQQCETFDTPRPTYQTSPVQNMELVSNGDLASVHSPTASNHVNGDRVTVGRAGITTV